MNNFFRLQEHNTTVSTEILCGITTFLTMSYILFVNPAIVSQSGMPAEGVFAATALTAAMCGIAMGLFANVPFAMASGMGVNTFFAYVICGAMGFHWKEGLTIMFVTGLLHVLVMATGTRKALVNAIPHHLKMAFGAGLGLFIAYIGLKTGGFLMFTTPPGQYMTLPGGTVISNSASVPGLSSSLGTPQVIALIGLAVMLVLLALERKTGDSYAALPAGILTATFIGIPLQLTDIAGVRFIDLAAVLRITEVFNAFWGDPGLLSIIGNPNKLLLSALAILVLLATNVMDSVGTVIGIGQAQGGATVFTDREVEAFSKPGNRTRLDRSFLCNAFGGSVASLMGTTTATIFMESITGIVAGGRTGLTAVVTGAIFLLCIPLAHFFSIVPAAAIAPALIVAGAFMIPLVSRIRWDSFEEAFPAFITILCIPMTYGFFHGIAAGVLAHLIIQIGVGKWRAVHPVLYAIAGIFLLALIAERWM